MLIKILDGMICAMSPSLKLHVTAGVDTGRAELERGSALGSDGVCGNDRGNTTSATHQNNPARGKIGTARRQPVRLAR